MCYSGCPNEYPSGDCKLNNPKESDCFWTNTQDDDEIIVDPPGISMEAVARMAGFRGTV